MPRYAKQLPRQIFNKRKGEREKDILGVGLTSLIAHYRMKIAFSSCYMLLLLLKTLS
jgi:hypothetical protein